MSAPPSQTEPQTSPAAVPAYASAWPGRIMALDFTGHGASTLPSGGGYTAELVMADADIAIQHIAKEVGGMANLKGKKISLVYHDSPYGKEPIPALEARAQEIKRMCGTGGTVRDDAIEIQGDHRERIAEKLKTLGYKVKLAGG